MMRIFGMLSFLAVPTVVAGGPHFWVIGGGPTPEENGAQIEFNVKWVASSLRQLVPGAPVSVYFANGTVPWESVHEYLLREGGRARTMQPLARVFGEEEEEASVYRRQDVPDVLGSNRAQTVIPALEEGLSRLRDGDQAMIVYNGHGSWNKDRTKNAFRLWGGTHLSVRQFSAILSHAKPDVPVRFVLTQCFSGAFERAVHPAARDVLKLARGIRCGFFAESPNRESEGCSPSVQVGDYRDYTTYFFAALTGRTRLGQPVAGKTDFNGDGKVTPFEAHLYALAYGYNMDLPRSTSEVFLERWEPWSLRWLDTGSLPDNVYGEVARIIERENHLPPKDPALARAMDSRHRILVGRLDSLQHEQSRIQASVHRMQTTIQTDLADRWPEIAHPYTDGYLRFLKDDLEAANERARSNPVYPHLVASQDSLRGLKLQLITAKRDIAQIEKLRRTRHLARLLAYFQRHASAQDAAAYHQLRACEELPLSN